MSDSAEQIKQHYEQSQATGGKIGAEAGSVAGSAAGAATTEATGVGGAGTAVSKSGTAIGQGVGIDLGTLGTTLKYAAENPEVLTQKTDGSGNALTGEACSDEDMAVIQGTSDGLDSSINCASKGSYDGIMDGIGSATQIEPTEDSEESSNPLTNI